MPVNAGFWPGSRLDRLMKIPGPSKPAFGQVSAVTLSLNGIASGAILGNSSLAASFTEVGIPSGAKVGNQGAAAVITDVGIASGARIGSESSVPSIDAVGIPSGARLGNSVVFSGIILYPNGIPSGARVGDQTLAPSIGSIGIPAGIKIGSSSFSASVFAMAIGSGAKIGDGSLAASIKGPGIVSSVVVGNESASSSMKPAGIPSGTVLGSQSTALTARTTGIASGAVGLPSLAEVLRGIGVPSEIVGIPSVVPQTFTQLNLIGIPGSSVIGITTLPQVPVVVPPPLADAIYDFVSAVLESAYAVLPLAIWEYEGGPRPNVFPYLSLNVVAARGIGQAWQSPIAADVGGQAIFLPKDWTVRLNGWGAGSRDLVESIRRSLEAPWWLDELESLGLAYRGASQPRAAHRIVDFSPEHGWSMDITFGVTAELAQAIAAWIEFAVISGTIVAPDGTQVVLPAVTVGE